MTFRGALTLLALAVSFVVCDLVQRTVIVGLGWLLPSKRNALFARWQRGMAAMVMTPLRYIGGARFGELPRIPGRAGVLVVMNHQSLVDIPIVVASMEGEYPRILTRKRYGRGAPVVSHMARLYQYPLLDPGATTRGDLARLRRQAAESTHPYVIYPEGTRSRTGEIGRFKKLGLRTVLEARQWTVYVVVADGFWRFARLKDFARNLSTIRGRVECAGPVESPEPGSDMGPFIDQLRGVMLELKDRIRGVPVP